MEMKEQLINAVIRNMEPELEVSQLKKLGLSRKKGVDVHERVDNHEL